MGRIPELLNMIEMNKVLNEEKEEYEKKIKETEALDDKAYESAKSYILDQFENIFCTGASITEIMIDESGKDLILGVEVDCAIPLDKLTQIDKIFTPDTISVISGNTIWMEWRKY